MSNKEGFDVQKLLESELHQVRQTIFSLDEEQEKLAVAKIESIKSYLSDAWQTRAHDVAECRYANAMWM
mgnify:CR=1 FL=1